MRENITIFVLDVCPHLGSRAGQSVQVQERVMTVWRAGRGVLGPLRPLLGNWVHEGQTKLGATKCRREFAETLSGKFIELRARWRTTEKSYEEVSFFGLTHDKALAFWSFTSDGGQAFGEAASAPDVHERCVCFESEMPAGRARMLYWPHPGGGFWFAVEAQTGARWRRFLEQHFVAAER
jgi:hypothetical protein